jgi:glucokinase
VRTTNLPWLIDARELAGDLGLGTAGLINDLEANAWGIGALGPDDFAVLNEGAPGAHGNQAVIAAGTGLGEAGLYWDGAMHRPFACEGGHANFAPSGPVEIDLLRYLAERFDHVSWERVVSGPGVFNVYAFLRDTDRGRESAAVAEHLKTDDPSAVVSRSALLGKDPLASAALELFARLYGSEAGNLALKMMATGGVFVGGGVAPKILPKLREGGFMDAFKAKGPMRRLVESIPVRVVLNDKAALIGAARFAKLETRG